ncbi:MAG TPA: hypothetical protein VGG25_09995 [Streptosporangiaceae bacterium]
MLWIWLVVVLGMGIVVMLAVRRHIVLRTRLGIVLGILGGTGVPLAVVLGIGRQLRSVALGILPGIGMFCHFVPPPYFLWADGGRNRSGCSAAGKRK